MYEGYDVNKSYERVTLSVLLQYIQKWALSNLAIDYRLQIVHTHIHAHTHTYSYSHTHTHTDTYTHTHTLTQTLTYTH